MIQTGQILCEGRSRDLVPATKLEGGCFFVMAGACEFDGLLHSYAYGLLGFVLS